jgi:hypothetical protein
MPSHIRLSDGITLDGQERVTPRTKPGITVPATRPGTAVQAWLTAPPTASNTSCGHIIVIPVTPDIDPQAVIKIPLGQTSKMPTFKGLPACDPAFAR